MDWNFDPSWSVTLWTWFLTICWVCPLYGFRSWPFVEFVHVVDLSVALCWVRPSCGLEYWPFVGSIHFVDLSIDPLLGPSTLWTCLMILVIGSVHIVDCSLDLLWGLSTLWTCLMILVIGSVHIVDCSLDPLWGPSTLWTCLNFQPSSLGLSTDSSNLIVVITHSIVWMFLHKI